MPSQTEPDWWKPQEAETGDFTAVSALDLRVRTRQVDGEWEYAIVHWDSGSTFLLCQLKDGKVISDDSGT